MIPVRSPFLEERRDTERVKDIDTEKNKIESEKTMRLLSAR